MIWFTLGLFVVSFLLTALLTPKPEFEDARPESLDPDNFPKASEESPVALLLGCAKIKGPNTLWYGNFQSIPVTEKVKTGLFSSTTVTTGYQYYLSLDIGLCLGPARLKTIYIDTVAVQSGITSEIDPVAEAFADSSPGGINSDNIGTDTGVGTYLWDHEFQDTNDNNPTYYNLVGDMGLSEAAIDAGDYTITVIRDPRAGSTSGLFTPSGTDIQLKVEFYSGLDGAGGEIIANELFDSTRIEVPNSGIFYSGPRTTLTGPIPSGCRSIGIFSYNQYDFPVTDVSAYDDHQISVTGSAIVYSFASFDINEPELYGGEKNGGGHVGNVQFYPGTFNQAVNSHMETSVGAGLVPAYRGISHMVWVNHYIGETPQLRKLECLMSSYTNNLETGFTGLAFDGSDDISPAEALYEILVDTWRGLSIDPADINIQSFKDAAATLITELHGVSLVVSSAQTGRKVVTEILRQIDGILYQDTTTGLISLRLIRDDYVAASLPIYDQDDIIKVTSFSKTAWADVKSQVKVTYSSRTKDSNVIAIAQNGATANMLGQLRTADISFPFCYRKATANKLAARELSVLSTPLFRMTVQMNRSGYAFQPGDVIKISWPEYGLTEVIMRVQKINIGDLLDGKIVVDLIQDVFAVSTVVFADPEDTSWVDDRPVPETLTDTAVVEMPYFFSSRLEFPVADGFADVIPFARQPKTASTAFSFLSGVVTGTLDTYEPYSIEYTRAARLVGAYDEFTGFETGLDATGITIDGLVGPNTDDDTPETVTTAELRTGEKGLIWINGEWLGYEGVTDNMDGTYTLTNVRRGLLGTRPLEHADNTSVFFLEVPLLGQGFKSSDLTETGTLYHKFLDQVGGTIRGVSSESEGSTAMADIADRPLRPRLLSIDGARTEVPWDASSDPTVSLTWETSNRASTQVAFENDADETPDQTEQYDLEIWLDGVQDMALSQDNITQPYALDVSSLSGSEGEVRLYSKRTGGDGKSSVYYAKYPFTLDSLELLSGDMTDGNDFLLTSGDEQSGGDGVKFSGDEG